MIKYVTLAISLLASSPVFAGDRVENQDYSLPDLKGMPANVHIVCMSTEALYELLDHLDINIQIYMNTGKQPDNCAVFYPLPVALGEHYLDHLYVTDNGKLAGIIRLPIEGADPAWTYIDEKTMVKGKEGTF